MSTTPKTVYTPDIVVTMDEARSVRTDAAVLVEDGVITAVGPRADVLSAHPDAARVDSPPR